MFLESITNKARFIIKYALSAFIFLFPFLLYKDYLYNGTSGRSVTLMLLVELLAIILGLALLSKKNILKIAKSPISLALAIYFIVLVVSALQGIDPSISFWSKATRMTGIFYLSHLFFFYLFLMMIFREEKDARFLIKGFLVSTGIFSIGSFLGAEGLGIIFKSKPWDGFSFGNSTFAAMYLFAAFMLSIYYVWSKYGKNKRWWHYFVPLIFIINPNFINSKLWFGKINIFQNPLSIVGEARATSYVVIASIFALFAVLIISKIKNVQIRRKIILGGSALAIILASIAIYSFLSPGGYIREAYLKQATSARPLVWELSNKAIESRPLFGWGPDNFERVFERHYDNRLLQTEFGGEAWFDRAHNVFIDQAVDTGYIGLAAYILVYLVIIGSLLYVILQSRQKNDQLLAVILLVYFAMHLAELQTAFDTSISLVAVAFMAALSATVFHRTWSSQVGGKSEWVLSPALRYLGGVLMVGYFGWSFFAGTLPIARAEAINGHVRNIGSTEKRLPMYDVLFGSPMDKPAFIWRILTDFQRGIYEDSASLENPEKLAGYAKEFEIYAEHYRKHLTEHPNDIRSHYTLADILIYERLFEVDHLKEAQDVLDKAIALNPNIPQPYWMKAVSYLYQRKFDLAREWAKKGLELNPEVKESQKLVDYIERQIKTFPEIDVYFFAGI